MIDKVNPDSSFSTPTQQRSVLLPSNLTRSAVASNIGGNFIPEKKKFTNRKDLEQYYLMNEGSSKLTTFLVPDLE